MVHVRQAGRALFAGGWVAIQAALVATAPLRPDHIFGFRMFPEASTMEVHLARDLGGGRVVAAPRGEWRAIDRRRQPHEFSWRDRVRDPVLASLDARVFASYGLDAQLARLKVALDDVVDHIPDDAETKRLVAQVVVSRNGREPATVTLESHPRRDR